MKMFKNFIVILVLALCCFGCNRPYEIFTLKEDDSKSIIRLSVGQLFAVELKENATTGYMWKYEPRDDTTAIILKHDTFTSPSDRIGAAGTHIFTFETMQPGTATISILSVRPWEENEPPVDEFILTVKVQ